MTPLASGIGPGVRLSLLSVESRGRCCSLSDMANDLPGVSGGQQRRLQFDESGRASTLQFPLNAARFCCFTGFCFARLTPRSPCTLQFLPPVSTHSGVSASGDSQLSGLSCLKCLRKTQESVHVFKRNMTLHVRVTLWHPNFQHVHRYNELYQ